MKKISLIFQNLSIMIGIFLILFFILPIIFGIKPFIVLSGSMEPKIKTGSIAYINTHIPAEKIKVGDIIGFKISNGQVTHRVIAINNDKTFTTKGDMNNNEDFSHIKFDEYVGKTEFSIPFLGKIIVFFKTKVGIICIIIFILINILNNVYIKNISKHEDDA